ncbi:MAG: porin family protein [Rikenellaceae bacterium]
MKKLLLMSILSAMFINQTQAQEYPRWTFGPKAGMNLSSIVATELMTPSTRVGFTAGMFAEYHINDWMGISIEALYSEKGAKTTFDEEIPADYIADYSYVESENKFLLNYINVPIMAHFYVAEGLSLNVGFQTGFKVQAKFENEGDADSPASTVSMWDDVRPVDLAIPMGMSYTFRCGLMLDARYEISVNSIMKKDQYLTYMKGTNSSFSITAGWRF